MKPRAPAGPPVYLIIQDSDGAQYLDQEGRAPLDPGQFQMARATDKTILRQLYPDARDLTNLVKLEEP